MDSAAVPRLLLGKGPGSDRGRDRETALLWRIWEDGWRQSGKEVEEVATVGPGVPFSVFMPHLADLPERPWALWHSPQTQESPSSCLPGSEVAFSLPVGGAHHLLLRFG